MRTQYGITLTELMITLAIIAIICAAGVAGTARLIANARMASTINRLVHLVHQARQASLATGKDIVLCPSANGRNCVTDAQWDSGWLMFSNTDSDHPPDIDSGETILATEPAFTGLRVLANRSAFVIRPHGLRSTNGTLVFCSRQADIAGRRLIVSYTGKPRTALMNSADSQTVCGRSAS